MRVPQAFSQFSFMPGFHSRFLLPSPDIILTLGDRQKLTVGRHGRMDAAWGLELISRTESGAQTPCGGRLEHECTL